jgi:hypothetical protein
VARIVAAVSAFVAAASLLAYATQTETGGGDKSVKHSTEFTGKFVIVEFRSGSRSELELIKGPAIRRLGGRDFLVGEYAIDKDEERDWKGVVLWIPVEGIESLVVFDKYEPARRAADDARTQRKAANKK